MPRVAILIDGDNISPGLAPEIDAIGRRLGEVQLRRVYANATHCPGWTDVPGVRFVHAGAGKNAADILLSIEAIEFACMDGYETFLLASSDGDFTHLATRLRERGHSVVGAGEAKPPPMFRAACTRFEELARACGPPRPAAKTGPTGIGVATPMDKAASRNLSPLDRKIMDIIAASNREDGGAHLAWVGQKLSQDVAGRPVPAGGLKKHVAGKPEVFELYPSEQPVAVRLRARPDRA